MSCYFADQVGAVDLCSNCFQEVKKQHSMILIGLYAQNKIILIGNCFRGRQDYQKSIASFMLLAGLVFLYSCNKKLKATSHTCIDCYTSLLCRYTSLQLIAWELHSETCMGGAFEQRLTCSTSPVFNVVVMLKWIYKASNTCLLVNTFYIKNSGEMFYQNGFLY